MSYDRLLIWQYQAKPKAKATAQLLDREFGETWKGIASLPLALSIDDATGVNLDLVGKHVGQSRVLPNLAPRALFGFVDSPGALGFNKGGSGGGRWYRLGDPIADSVVLDDVDYRFLIRCRVARNYMVGTIDDVTRLVEFIFGEGSGAYDAYDMTISVLLPTESITPFKQYAVKQMDILPRPAGVGIKFFAAMPKTAFGFFGAPNAAGFNAGVFARLI